MTRLVYCPGVCRECGCDDEHACVVVGAPCHWIEPDLCSACAPSPLGIVGAHVGEDLGQESVHDARPVDEDLDDDLVEPYEDDGESPILARTVYDAIRRSAR